MAGLIANALGQDPTTGQNMTAYSADTAKLDPTLRQVDPAKETVAGQLTDILSKGSPYLDRARASAAETANSRGLLNTSMAAGAGEAAAIDSALPIAQADANTYKGVADVNQGYQNNASQFNAAATNTSNTNTANAANETAQQSLKGGQANQLAQIEANYKSLIQTSASASQLFQNASNAITAVLSDTTTSDAQKQAAVDKIKQLLQSGLNVTGSVANVDLNSLLDFS